MSRKARRPFIFPTLSCTAIFIDGGYLNKVLELFDRVRIDYGRLSNLLAGGTEVLRSYYYHCMPYRGVRPTEIGASKMLALQHYHCMRYRGVRPTPAEETRYAAMRQFVDYLQKTPRFEVRLGRLAKRDKQCGQCRQEWSEFEQKRVDVLFAADLMRLAASQQIGRAVLVSSAWLYKSG